jgi:hypothetical protein
MMINGERGTQASPIIYPTEQACKEANAEVEGQIKKNKSVVAYALKCVEVTSEDVKRNGESV